MQSKVSSEIPGVLSLKLTLDFSESIIHPI